jgi:TonB family protein
VLKALIVAFALLSSSAAQVEKRNCDHPAPPEGMHYVCSPKDSCDCRLERDSSEIRESSGTAATSSADSCSPAGLRYFVVPAYPPAARAARKQATIKAQLTVGASGTAEVKIESGNPAFDEAVLDALRKWRFASGEKLRTLKATFTFAIAGDATDSMRTTIAGSSPLNLVISVSPPLR